MNDASVFRVIHLIPYDGIGGVETAARSMREHSRPTVNFCCHYIYRPPKTRAARLALFTPWPPFRAAVAICAADTDLLIVSLWRSCIAALLAKLFRPRLRMVLFLHLSEDAHFLDRVLTWLVSFFAEEVWADSKQTSAERLGQSADRVISFLIKHMDRVSSARHAPRFIFWGRLNRQKNIPMALTLFHAISERIPDATYLIIGPDGGDKNKIISEIDRLGLNERVQLTGPADREGIVESAFSSTFYLQTSMVEGMAMSVVEAMQMGIVPIVTPVGEIKNYCKHFDNAIIVKEMNETVDTVVNLFNDPAELERLSVGASLYWRGRALYADDVFDACLDMLNKRAGSRSNHVH
ncbi:MAG: glycosyltransferase [Pseudomonadota bacterium]